MGASGAAGGRSLLSARGGRRSRIGDRLALGVTGSAAALTLVLVGLLIWKVVDGAWPAIARFGIPFVWERVWNPNVDVYSALPAIYGTAVTTLVATLIAAPIAIAIGLYLAELAPRRARGPVGTLVELLAAVPSVVLGLWGILVLGPFVRDHFEHWLGGALGWIPLFRGQPQQAGLLPAILILSIMIVPITASLSRELFLNVPRELKEGAYGLGLTRWEMIRCVVLPYTKGGVTAAVVLGAGRALGEAIAVTQVIGGFWGINTSFFAPGETLASRIASQYQGATTGLQAASLVYLAVILLVLTLLFNALAQWVVSRSTIQVGR